MLSVLGLLYVPGQASAQIFEHPYRVEGFVVGGTDPDPSDHQLGVNRVSGTSDFGELAINAVIDCEDELVFVQLAPIHPIRYVTDDDVTDGFGEIDPTDETRLLEGLGTEIRVPSGEQSPAQVRVRIVEGRFHRVVNVVEVSLRLDIRVVRNPGGANEALACQTTDATREPEVRILFSIVGPDPRDADGFFLVGEARRHDPGDDGNMIARPICGLVSPHSTRVTQPPDPVPPGRGDFHPCPPEGQQ